MPDRGIRYIVRDGVSESMRDSLVREKLSFLKYTKATIYRGKKQNI